MLNLLDIIFFIALIYVVWKLYTSETFGDGKSYDSVMWQRDSDLHRRGDVEPRQISTNVLPPSSYTSSDLVPGSRDQTRVASTIDYGIRRQYSTYDDAMADNQIRRNKAQRDAHLNKHTYNLDLARDLFEDELAKNENRDWFTNWDDNTLVRPGEIIPTPYTPNSLLRH